MGDPRVGQLQRLHDIIKEQLAAYPSRAIGVLGIAGGNGLDLIDPETTDAVYGYDVNPDYLAACEARYRDDFGDRLHLIETRIDRSVTIERVDLLIANLIIEYVGIDEFVASRPRTPAPLACCRAWSSETTRRASSARRTTRRRSKLSPRCHRRLIPRR